MGKPATSTVMAVEQIFHTPHISSSDPRICRQAGEIPYGHVYIGDQLFCIDLTDEECALLLGEITDDGSCSTHSDHHSKKREKPPKQSTPISGYVYLVQSGDRFKIGLSRNPQKRIAHLAKSPSLSAPIITICTIQFRDMYALESALHDLFSHRQVYHEWFELSPTDVQFIQEMSNV